MTGMPAGVAERTIRRLTPEPERELPTDPVRWTRERAGIHLWSKQRAILRSVVEHRKTAVQSCHGIGKTFTAADAAAWWTEAHPLGEALVVSTAPSGDQVRKLLWGEIRKLHGRAALPGSISRAQSPSWTVGELEVAFGRKPADYIDENTARSMFQGIHARYLLVLLDEAGGIPKWLWDAVQSLVTNEGSRILAIGNPDDPTTEFARVCAPGSGYNVIKVSAFDTPNFTSEEVPEQLRESLVGPTYVAEAERLWGLNSPLYTSKVLGEFPEVADDVIISPKLVREARERDLSGRALTAESRAAMDVADVGEAETIIMLNRGGMLRVVQAWRGVDTDTGRSRAQAYLDGYPTHDLALMIDFPGVGGAVFHPLANAGYNVTAFNGGEQANDPSRFANRNAEAWWGLRELMEAELIDLDPDDDVLASQLQSRKWKLASDRRIRIETKEEMAKRGIPSPDRADAAVMSVYDVIGDVGDAEDLVARAREASIVGADWLTRPT